MKLYRYDFKHRTDKKAAAYSVVFVAEEGSPSLEEMARKTLAYMTGRLEEPEYYIYDVTAVSLQSGHGIYVGDSI